MLAANLAQINYKVIRLKMSGAYPTTQRLSSLIGVYQDAEGAIPCNKKIVCLDGVRATRRAKLVLTILEIYLAPATATTIHDRSGSHLAGWGVRPH